jgi:N-acetylneuraminate synthase
MNYETSIRIRDREIALDQPTYFIADIAANHDGDLGRAKRLVELAAEAGADAVKFQHFLAPRIVSDRGFRSLGGQIAHQAAWKKPVYEIYEQYEYDRTWDEPLIETARRCRVDWFTAPYDFAAIDAVAPKLDVFKIGSGEVTWIEALERVARKGKPVMLATGASSMADVERAVEAVLRHNRQLLLMQCNTNYTAAKGNFARINLNVLRSFALHWPGMPLGLSDHTHGHATVLGAIALGARAVEKHFTDDNDRAGPDHPFSMTPRSWREMVDRSRELEAALGDGVKRIEPNEVEAAVVQRRCIRFARDVEAGTVLRNEDVECLRPAPAGSLAPYELSSVLGRRVTADRRFGDAVYPADLEETR